MLASAPLVAFVPTTDLDRARAFYGGTLGLTETEASPYAVAFNAGGTMLRVTLVPSLTPHPFTVLGWGVDDIGGTLAELRDRGVEALRYDGMSQDESGVWRAPSGALVAWFHDLDGNVLSLTQFQAD